MGVYNPKALMPYSCGDCWCNDGITCEYLDVDCYIVDYAQTERIHPDCPLVEVKAPHGRLIDADVLEQDAQKRMLICNQNDNQFQKPYEVMRAIALAPTIIPAEEGEP